MTKTLMIAVMALMAGTAFADKVYLKSGAMLIGKAGDAEAGAIVFKSDDLGDVKIKLENIVKLEDAGEHVIKYNDGSETKMQLAVDNGKYVEGQQPVDMKEVKAIDPVPEKWHGSVHVGFNATRGNAYKNAGNFIFNINRRWEKDRLTGDLSYNYSKSGTTSDSATKSADRWVAEVKHGHFWWPKVYNYTDLKFERDMVAALRARYRIGEGLGYQWLDDKELWNTGKWSFSQELGLNWVKEDYENAPDTQKKYGYCAVRYAHHLTWHPAFQDGFEFFHNAEILPEIDEWSVFTSTCDLGFSTKIIFDLSLLAKMEWDYNSKPAADKKRSDLRYIVGLGYKW